MLQPVVFEDLGAMHYREAWDYQEHLLQKNLRVKSSASTLALNRETLFAEASQPEALVETGSDTSRSVNSTGLIQEPDQPMIETVHHLLLVEHPPVYTLGKSGKEEHILISEQERERLGIEYFRINRGGDITFHGPGQIVGYPVLDLEKFYTDIGRYLRELEEVIILTLAEYGIKGQRSTGETGVWIEPEIRGRERKICAMGVRCSRWITMHGFAFNVNTDLSYFDHIVPCGIRDKQVTSLQKEIGHPLQLEEVKEKLKMNFEKVFNVQLIRNL
jgi:lipoyl(octanoyl) transferase